MNILIFIIFMYLFLLIFDPPLLVYYILALIMSYVIGLFGHFFPKNKILELPMKNYEIEIMTKSDFFSLFTHLLFLFRGTKIVLKINNK